VTISVSLQDPLKSERAGGCWSPSEWLWRRAGRGFFWSIGFPWTWIFWKQTVFGRVASVPRLQWGRSKQEQANKLTQRAKGTVDSCSVRHYIMPASHIETQLAIDSECKTIPLQLYHRDTHSAFSTTLNIGMWWYLAIQYVPLVAPSFLASALLCETWTSESYENKKWYQGLTLQ